jgi:invasion protein IalB
VKRFQISAVVYLSLIVTASFGTIRDAAAQGVPAVPLKVASLTDNGATIGPGDVLRTTRIFPNWNLNCEVLLTQGRHLCAVEMRSVDKQGRQVFAWSIALATDGNPVIIFKVPADVNESYGLRMVIGAFTTILTPRREDCSPAECRIVAPFETALRTLMVSQQKITFAVMRDGQVLQIDAPLAGLSEALDMARRDPIGLLAAQRLSAPSVPAKLANKPKRTPMPTAVTQSAAVR